VRTGTYAQLFVSWEDPTIKLTLAGDDEIEILSFCEECGEEEHATKDCPHIVEVDPDYPDGIYIQEGYEGE
jgi:hypothetical protein